MPSHDQDAGETSAEPLLIEDRDGVRHLRFNKPAKLNALDAEQHDRVCTALGDAARDDSVRVVAFSGEGRSFCAGDDLGSGARLPRMAPRSIDLSIGSGPVLLFEVTTLLRNLPKPTVALLHGHALGSGYDYSLSCDFRVASEDVKYGDPRINLAIWAAEGWSYKLPRLVNQSIVSSVDYMGELMDGQTAYARGLVHRLYPAGADLRAAAAPFLQQLAALDPAAYAATKERILAGVDVGFEYAQRFR